MIHSTRYARALRLRRIQPNSGTSAVLSEGAIAVAALLALAELAPWPVIVILPVAVACGLKLGDEALLIAARRAGARGPAVTETTQPVGVDASCAGTVYRSTAVPSDAEPGQTDAPALAPAAADFPAFAARRSRWTRQSNIPDARSVGVNQRQSVWIKPHTETPPQR
jgi:hypothetical protein